MKSSAQFNKVGYSLIRQISLLPAALQDMIILSSTGQNITGIPSTAFLMSHEIAT